MKSILSFLFAWTACLAVANAAETANSSDPSADSRLQWWRDARFGMFIHWDMSSVAGTEISWSRNGPKPMDGPWGSPAGTGGDPVYDSLYRRFNPTKFDARQWVKIAQNAGMKYVVFTTKHHGGFCMWDTKYTDYSIMHTPFKRDVVKELADACHEAGLHFGIYYSPRDWHHPDYGVGDDSKYLAYLKGQLTELLSNYGKVDVVWFDSFGSGDSIKYWHADEVLALVKKLQPQAVINNRCSFFGQHVDSLQADFDTPEQTLGAYQVNRPWESCMCMTPPHWSYVPGATLVGLPECVRNLVGCATGDGNLLLDVGPAALGEIPANEVERLTEVGQWLNKYGDSIYGTRGGPFRNGNWGGATFRGNKIFLHLFDAAPDTIRLPAIGAQLTSAKNLAGGTVKAVQKDGRVTVTVADGDRAHPDTIVELAFDKPISRVGGGVEMHESALLGLDDLAGPDATVRASSLLENHSREMNSLLKGTCQGSFAFHTMDEKTPWIVIDLKRARHVQAVQIENRSDMCQDRAKTLTMWVSSDGANWTEAWKAPSVADRWTAIPELLFAGAKIKGADARYIKLGLQENTPTAFHLRSVRVYGH